MRSSVRIRQHLKNAQPWQSTGCRDGKATSLPAASRAALGSGQAAAGLEVSASRRPGSLSPSPSAKAPEPTTPSRDRVLETQPVFPRRPRPSRPRPPKFLVSPSPQEFHAKEPVPQPLPNVRSTSPGPSVGPRANWATNPNPQPCQGPGSAGRLPVGESQVPGGPAKLLPAHRDSPHTRHRLRGGTSSVSLPAGGPEAAVPRRAQPLY